MKMKFRAHDTFFIRKGWLYKGMKNVARNQYVFMGDNGNPMDILGVGANMCKALRYWLQAVGLTQEPATGRKSQTLTPLGQIVYDQDKYIEEMGNSLNAYLNYGVSYDKANKQWIFDNKLIHFLSDGENATFVDNSENALSNGISLKVVRKADGEIDKLVAISNEETQALLN